MSGHLYLGYLYGNSITLKKQIMMYNIGFWGMNMIWWFLWFVMIFWIFATPYDIPGQRKRKNSPLDLLQKRFASGEITKEEYQDHKKILENDLAKG
jgi:putative membrane protein